MRRYDGVVLFIGDKQRCRREGSSMRNLCVKRAIDSDKVNPFMATARTKSGIRWVIIFQARPMVAQTDLDLGNFRPGLCHIPVQFL